MNESKEDLDKRQKTNETKEKQKKKEIVHTKSKELHSKKLYKKLKKKHKLKPRMPKLIELELSPKKTPNKNKYNLLKQIIIKVFSIYENLNTIDIMNVIKNDYLHKYARNTISEACNILEREEYLIKSNEIYIGRGRPKVLWIRGKKIILKNNKNYKKETEVK